MTGILTSSVTRQKAWATFMERLKPYQLIVNGSVMKKSTLFDLLFDENSTRKLECVQDRSIDCFSLNGTNYRIKFKERTCAGYDGNAEEERAIRHALSSLVEKHLRLPKDEKELRRIFANFALEVHLSYEKINKDADKQHKKI